MLNHLHDEQINVANTGSKLMIAGVIGLALIIVGPSAISYITGNDIMSGKVNGTDTTALIPPALIHRTFGAGQLIGGIVAAGLMGFGGVKLELKKKLLPLLPLLQLRSYC